MIFKSFKDRIDSITKRNFIGPIFLFFSLFIVYQITFWIGNYPSSWVAEWFDHLSAWLVLNMKEGDIRSLLIDGVLGGVGGVLQFAPTLFCLFVGITFIEELGLMSRMTFTLDKIFRKFHLSGASALAFIMSGGIGGGCTAPGILFTRNIPGSKQRLLTILTAPFMVCGGKLPVIALVIAALTDKHQGLWMFLAVFLAWPWVLFLSWILGNFIGGEEVKDYPILWEELRRPHLKHVLLMAWIRTKIFFYKAGTWILFFSIVMWFLLNYPKGISGIEFSFAGRIGHFLEPFGLIAGLDWQMILGLISGLAGKELVIGTLSTIHSLHEGDNSILSGHWSSASIASFLVFFTMYSPCLGVVSVIVKETGRWLWGAVVFLGYSLLAFAISALVYQIAMLF